mgnify:CR=1 FL=1
MSCANFKTQKYFDLYITDECEIYDEENKEYYFDDYLYNSTQHKLDKINDKMDFFNIELESGYYSGIQTYIKEKNNYNYYDEPLYILENYKEINGKEIFKDYGFNKYILKKKILKEINLINNKYLKSLENFDHYKVAYRFSNGETCYTKVKD